MGDLTTVDIHTLLDMFLNTFMMSASFINEAFFLVKSKTFDFGITLLNCQISKLSRLSDNRLKEFCCVILYFAQIFILKMYLILIPALYTVCRMNAACLQILYEVAKHCACEFPNHKFYYVYKCF